MEYRRVGYSGLKVSKIALGGWINFGEGKVAADTARQVVTTAYEQGINFFDLADSYGRGAAEEQMGRMLAEFPRHTLVVSTKVFWPFSDDINDRGLSRKHIMESIDRSLKRLGMDYVDLYFCHRPDPETPILETARAMNDLIQQGKALYWGTSEWSPAQIVEAYELCRRYGWHAPQVEQPQYSMLWRPRVEEELLPAVGPRGIGLTVFSPLAMGMLTGKYDNGVGDDTRFAREPWAKERFLNEANADRVRRLRPIADRLGISRAQLALAWTLRLPEVSCAIIGATQPSQVVDNAAAAEVDLSEQDIAEIEAILTAPAG
jgi:voltage-dependent potassium channel beta subunit